jgi:lambda family phage tail tape measure protein
MADNEVSIKFTGDSSGAEDASKRTKEQVDKATESLKILDDLLGVKIPESISKMLAESELIGPALDAAFAPLAIISLGMALIDVTDKVSKFVGEALTGAADLRKFDEQIKTENKSLEEYARKTKEATRALELLNAPDAKARNALKLQFQIEDQGGSAAQLAELLKTKTTELQELLHKNTTETVSDIGSGMTVEVEKLVSETDEGKEKINELSSAILQLGARQKEAAAEEALTNKQNQNDLDREASQRAAIASQQKALAAQRSAQRAVSAAEEQKFFEDALHRHNKILTAKQLEAQAAKEDATAAAALARYNEQQVKAAQQEAALAEKGAENNAKIEQLHRDIADNQAKHNAELSVALGYTTQEKADAQALAKLEKDKSTAIDDINSRLNAQIGIVKNLGAATMNGMLGSPEQKAAYQKAVLEYQKLKIDELNLEKKYDDQIAGLQLKLTNTSAAQLRRQMLQWQNVHQEMVNQFMASLNSMNQSLASFVVTGKSNWKNLASSAIESMVSMVLKYEESKAIMEILDALGLSKKKISNAAEAHSSASTASANTLADVPYPANIPAAAQVFTLGEALAIEAKSSAGGDWRVDRDRLNFVHTNETILPAGIAGKLRDMVEGGGTSGGVTVVVNHSVSAVDAASFQGHIRRHSNMIANEVTRALKRKGAR